MDRKGIISIAIVTLVGYLTYFHGYADSPYFFWDENYHVAQAQKYLHGVFFMEPHPPLGKLLIALGEYLLHPNASSDQFLGTLHAASTPEGFSFAGYRFFPALLAWLTAPLFLISFYLITKRWWWATALSSLYLFDNALIVHQRGAMLDGIQIFFIMVAIIAMQLLISRSDASRTRRFVLGWGIVLGGALAAAFATKINAAVLIFLVPYPIVGSAAVRRMALPYFAAVSISFLFVYGAVWQSHFLLARTIDSRLPDQGTFKASPELHALLAENVRWSLPGLWYLHRDAVSYSAEYQNNVPRLNLCKSEENGSHPLLWPFGARSINYRWKREDGATEYRYLQSNPVSWALSLCGIVGSASFLVASMFLGISALRNGLFIRLFLLMYSLYMGIMLAADRVLYLYHYFIPLIFGYLLFAAFINEVRTCGECPLTERAKSIILTVLALLTIVSFGFFAPLSYGIPLTNEELGARSWLKLWDLRCAGCTSANGIASPTCDPKVRRNLQIAIEGVAATVATQDWGEPIQNLTVERQPIIVAGQSYPRGIGTHARSSIEFSLNSRFSRMTGAVGVPDYALKKSGTPASVSFEIHGNSKLLWSSKTMRAGDNPAPFDIDVRNVQTLVLKVLNGGNGIDNDSAVWLEPRLYEK